MTKERYKITIDIHIPERMITKIVSHAIGEIVKGSTALRRLDLDLNTKKPKGGE